MSLGTKYARGSRKTDLVVAIGMLKMDRGMTLDEARELSTELKKKSNNELELIYRELKEGK